MKRTRKPIEILSFCRRTSGLFYSRGEYVVDIRLDEGRRIRRKFGTDKTYALRRFDELVEELGEAKRDADDPRVADFLREVFLPSQRALKSYAFSESAVKAVVRFLNKTEPGLRLSEVGVHHLQRLRVFYSDHAARSQNAYSQKLSQALNHAVALGVLAANPLARVKPLVVDNRRTKYLRMEDFVRIVEAAAVTDALDLFVVMGLTGLRPSNVRLLTVGELDGTTIRIPPEKMKNKRWGVIPVSRVVAAVLVGRALGESEALFFPTAGDGNRAKARSNLSRTYRNLVRRLDGLQWSTLYDLRHFFASQLAKQGANEQQIGRLLCHVGHSVTSRYVHHDIEDLRPLVETLSERFLGATGGATSPFAKCVDGDVDRIIV